MVSTRSRVRLTTRFTGSSDVLLLGYTLMGPEGREVLPEDRLSLSYHWFAKDRQGSTREEALSSALSGTPEYPSSDRDVSMGTGRVAAKGPTFPPRSCRLDWMAHCRSKQRGPARCWSTRHQISGCKPRDARDRLGLQFGGIRVEYGLTTPQPGGLRKGRARWLVTGDWTPRASANRPGSPGH